MTTPEPIAVTLIVIEALEIIGVPYVIGGSLASTLHGVARATLDSDLVADLQLQHAQPLVALLHDEFYVDESAVIEAIHQRRSFNLIHLPTMFKVDIFIPRQRAFDQAQLSHRVMQSIPTEPGRTIYIASPEDTILAKLEWYRMGGEVSERQWRDVVGILNVQGEQLDWEYLHRTATQLGIADLLDKLAAE
jgi:hypothetical protein